MPALVVGMESPSAHLHKMPSSKEPPMIYAFIPGTPVPTPSTLGASEVAGGEE